MERSWYIHPHDSLWRVAIVSGPSSSCSPNAWFMPPSDSPPSADGLQALLMGLKQEQEQIALGGGEEAIRRQHAKGRLTARERIERLIDPQTAFFELGLWAGWQMYQEW